MLNATYVITDTSIVLMLGGKHFQIPQDHPNFNVIATKLSLGDTSNLEELMDSRTAVRKWIGGNPRFRLHNDLLELDGRAFSDAITDKVLSMIEAGNNPNALVNFLIKVRKNPSNVAQQELLLFCVANGFMIHEDGDILAYKAVNKDYFDIHSRSVLNKPAALMDGHELAKFGTSREVTTPNGVRVRVAGRSTLVSMFRNDVDDNRDRTCSHGLHFAAYAYAQSFGGSDARMLLIKLSPENVVSIPSDYNNQKGRCALYEIVMEIENRQPLPKKEVYTDEDCGWDDDDCDGDCHSCGKYTDECDCEGDEEDYCDLCDTYHN